MKTLTVEEAQAELPSLLAAASRGHEVVIATGDDFIALHSVQHGATEYAKQEYGVTDEEMERFVRNCDEDYHRLKAEGNLIVLTADDIQKKLEEISRH